MRLLNTLLLLTRTSAPTTGVAAGAVYYDAANNEPKYHNGTAWMSFGGTGAGTIGFPEDVTTTYVVPDNRQVTYFDRFQNDGVLNIQGTGTLIGFR